jgi:hypothetical protein
VLAAVAWIVCLAGCGDRSAPDSGEVTIDSADDVLHRMVETYRNADSYRDRGLIRLQYRLDDQWMCDDGPFAVRFVRPNLLHLRAYQLTLASDGQHLRAIVADQETGDLDGQVLMKSTPTTLKLDTLYEDPVVLNTIAGGMGGPPLTLELLLGERPLDEVFLPTTTRQLLDNGEIGGQACYRVRAELPEGGLVFWIDQQSFALRRLEYPADSLARQLAQGMDCSEVTLTAEFRDARIGTQLYSREFAFDVPAGAKLVRRFVVPPQALSSNLLGRLPAEFFFVDLEGRQVTRQQLLGQVAVLVWFNDHPASQVALEQVEQLRQAYARAPQVTFHAVCTEPTYVGNSDLNALASRWGTSVPIVRDLEAFGRDVFQVPWAPTLVILDKRGVVQAFEVGANPQLSEQVGTLLKQLLDGRDLVAEVLANHQQQQAAYASQLADEAVGDSEDAELPGVDGQATRDPSGKNRQGRSGAELVPISIPGSSARDAASASGGRR